MRSPLRLAVADLNQTPLDWNGNLQNLKRAVEMAEEAGAHLLVTPELSLCGYGCEDQFLSQDLVLRAREALLQEVLPLSQNIALAVGLPLEHEGKVYNACAFLAEGKVLAVAAKQNLASSGVHYEPRWFSPWPSGKSVTGCSLGNSVPMGEAIIDFRGHRLGFEICEDAWVADRVGNSLVQQKVDIVLNPSASHFAFGKAKEREALAADLKVKAYAYANLVGNESGRTIYDGGSFIFLDGSPAARCPRLHYENVAIAVATLGSPSDLVVGSSRWETSDSLKEEEFARAVSLGLCDYLRKSHSKAFVISLSGGADSSAATILVGLMVRWGTKALGLAGFWQRLFSSNLPPTIKTESDFTKAILFTVYQATDQSSQTTRGAAAAIAAMVGATHAEWNVQSHVESYLRLLEPALGRKISWDQDDLCLQNVQARVRSPGIWLLANLRQSLLLSTSNRSEASVGYATMDGDTSGGLSPLGGIDKNFLRHWLRHLETKGLEGVPAMPELSVVNAQAPTAELRPAHQKQTDEADLMPYRVLDAIERFAVRDKREPAAAFALLQKRFPEYGPKELGGWVVRFYQLWCRNQWKRERYAPSFHLDEESVDPKTWCRFPILSGGFQREIEELKAELSL